MVERTNEEWLSALRGGGVEQANALTDLREYLRRAAFLYLRDRRPELSTASISRLYDMAEDFAQEAVLSIQQRLESFEGRSKFTTWAYRFVINAAASELRRRRYRHLSLEQILEEDSIINFIDLDDENDPATSAERQSFLGLIDQIMQSVLNEKQKTAVLAIHFRGLSVQETADLLNTSPNTVYKTLHDARKKIRAQLEAKRLSAGDILALFEKSL